MICIRRWLRSSRARQRTNNWRSFARIRSELGFDPLMRVPDGMDEVMRALDEQRFGDPYDGRFSNI